MKTTTSFSSSLALVITRYLELKQALGRRYTQERAVLHTLDSFLGDSGADLTADTFLRWCQTHAHLTPGVRRNRMRMARNLCLYRRRTEPTCFVPDPSLFPTPHQPVRPYIFSESEIARLLNKCAALPRTSNSPLGPEVFRLAIVLLYTTGLRRGELLRLTEGDYDPREQTLLIRASKFHKSRVLPLPPDVTHEIERYRQARKDQGFPLEAETPLLCNKHGGCRGYTGTGLGDGLHRVLKISRIQKPDGRLPRTHDFRHSFAVNALLRWYRSGVDVQSRLPFLAAYMGHVSIVSTYYYLHFIEPLATLASRRFAEHYGKLITPPQKQKGAPL